MTSRPLRGSWVPDVPTPGRYRCQRCGIEKPTKPTRRPPVLCADCKSVLRGLPATEEEATDENPESSEDGDGRDGNDAPARRPAAAVSA